MGQHTSTCLRFKASNSVATTPSTLPFVLSSYMAWQDVNTPPGFKGVSLCIPKERGANVVQHKKQMSLTCKAPAQHSQNKKHLAFRNRWQPEGAKVPQPHRNWRLECDGSATAASDWWLIIAAVLCITSVTDVWRTASYSADHVLSPVMTRPLR